GPRAGPRRTTQVFEGSVDENGNPDLDIAPALNGRHLVGRIWCAKGTKLGGDLRIQLPSAAELMLIVRSEAAIMAQYPVNTDGLTWPPAQDRPPTGLDVLQDGWISLIL